MIMSPCPFCRTGRRDFIDPIAESVSCRGTMDKCLRSHRTAGTGCIVNCRFCACCLCFQKCVNGDFVFEDMRRLRRFQTVERILPGVKISFTIQAGVMPRNSLCSTGCRHFFLPFPVIVTCCGKRQTIDFVFVHIKVFFADPAIIMPARAVLCTVRRNLFNPLSEIVSACGTVRKNFIPDFSAGTGCIVISLSCTCRCGRGVFIERTLSACGDTRLYSGDCLCFCISMRVRIVRRTRCIADGTSSANAAGG